MTIKIEVEKLTDVKLPNKNLMSIDEDSLGNIYIFYKDEDQYKIDHYLNIKNKNTYSFNMNDENIDFAQIVGDRILLVSAVNNEGKDNAFFFDKKACLQKTFNFGTGIEICKVDKEDKIWVGYSDEGIFEPGSIGENGIVCFDCNGDVHFNGFDEFVLKNDIPCIDHCNTITIFENEIWLCYYSNNYPIVRLAAKNNKASLFGELDLDPVKCMAVGIKSILIRTGKKTLSMNIDNGISKEVIFIDKKGRNIIFDKVFTSGNKLFGVTENNLYTTNIK